MIDTLELPPITLYQKNAIFCEERHAVIEATTKAGKTLGCLLWLMDGAFTSPDGGEFWWIAPIYEQTKIAFRRLRAMLADMDPAGSVWKANESELSVTLTNGSVFRFKSADKPDGLYGEDVRRAVIDEVTRCKEEAWWAVRSTLTATRGGVRLIGNVKGRKNWAWRLARKVEAGQLDGWKFSRITCYDAVKAGVILKAEVEQARRELPEPVFRELYEGIASEDGSNPFGLAAIRACHQPTADGNAPVVFGVDLAKSVDWTWVVGLDASGTVAFDERWQSGWNETEARLHRIIGDRPALIDSTGVGDPIVERLQSKLPLVEGLKFTSVSKQQLMEGLASAIQNAEIRFAGDELASELESFEYEHTRTGVRYCLAPETRVLTADLRHVRADMLAVGDALLAFDENPVDGNKTRSWRVASVTAAGVIERPCYRLVLEDGTQLQCSAEHLWLVEAAGEYEWKKTEDLRARHATSKSLRYAPHRLTRLTEVWSEDRSYCAGYLAAAFDGEGYICQQSKPHGGHGARVSMAQRDNEMAAHVRECLEQFGFKWSECPGSGTHGDVSSMTILGRRHEFLRFLGLVRPKRLLAKFNPNKLGTLDKKCAVAIESIEFVGMQTVVALGTSTATLIAEGIASHNSAPEGMHDDGVCALALAVKCLREHAPAPVWVPGAKSQEPRRLAGVLKNPEVVSDPERGWVSMSRERGGRGYGGW